MLALVAYSLKPVKLLGSLLGVVGTCCVRLHGPLLMFYQIRYSRENNRHGFGF